MANWKEYTTKTTPEDADEIMIADYKANVSKRTPFSGLWNWIANKLATAVISQLETQNKSIIPALNELNSNGIMNTTYATSEELQNDCYIRKIGKIVWINYSSDIKSIQKGTWTKIFDVPEEYKPFASTFIPVRSSTSNTIIRIMNTGEVQYYSDGEVNRQANFQFSGCYFTK